MEISGLAYESGYFRAIISGHTEVFFHPFMVGAKKQMFADFLVALYIPSLNVLE